MGWTSKKNKIKKIMKKKKNSKKFSIKVSIRIKPILSNSPKFPNIPIRKILKYSDRNDLRINNRKFQFDNLLLPTDKQEKIYDIVINDLLNGFKKGYNVCLFVYGQTGSGKTHTMLGKPGCLTENSLLESDIPQEWGLFPRTMLHLIRNKKNEDDNEKNEKVNIRITCSAVEIYFGNVFDLLNKRKRINLGTGRTSNKVPGGKKSCVYMKESERIKLQKEKEIVKSYFMKMKGQKKIEIKSDVELAKFARLIEATRTARSTDMNHRSSRSHCIIQVTKTQSRTSKKKSLISNFVFVDLAGSEKIKKSKVEGCRKLEAVNTNSSLTSLGRTIMALSKKSKFIPYRDSTLTMIMKEALGGNCQTHMIITVAQEAVHGEETWSSLLFGERTAKIKNKITKTTIDINQRIKQILVQIEEAEKEIKVLIKRGLNGGVNESSPLCTQKSFLRNKKLLEECKNGKTQIKEELAELRSLNQVESSKKYKQKIEKLKEIENSIFIYTGIVARMMLSGLYKSPHDLFIKKKDEIKNLKAQLNELYQLIGNESKMIKNEKYENDSSLKIRKWQIEFV